MNKWLYRAVGVASGALLMSGGVAHAHAASEAKPTVDPQAMRGLLADLFTPTGGQHHLGLTIDNTLPQPTDREELLPGLGLLGGASGNGGLLGGLTGGTGGKGLVGTLTGGLTSGLASGKSGLLGGLTGGDGPLGGLTSGLASTPLAGPLAGITNGLGSVAGADDDLDIDAEEPVLDPALLQDLAAANGGRLGVDGPASTDIVDPMLRGTALDTSNQRPVILDPAIARQVNDATAPVISGMIADAVAQKAAQAAPIEYHEEGLPLVGEVPVVGDLVGPKGPLSQFLVVGSLFDNLPVVGDLTRGGLDLGAVDRLPIAGKVLNQGLVQASDGPAIPVVGSLPLIGPAVGSLTKPLTTGPSPLGSLGSLTGGDGPLGSLTKGGGPLGSLTSGLTGSDGPLGSLTGGGDPLGSLTKGGGPLGSLTSGLTGSDGPLGSLTGGLSQPPMATTLPAPALPQAAQPSLTGAVTSLLPLSEPATEQPAGPLGSLLGQASAADPLTSLLPAAQRRQAGPALTGEPGHVGRHRAPTDTARPVVTDPEYSDTEATETLPLLSDTGVGALPVSGLVRNLPLVSGLPVLGQLDAPLTIVKALPVVGSIAGIVPIN